MRNLVVLCDGTWNKESNRTNIFRLRTALAKRTPGGVQQIARYNRGVGTDAATRLTGGLFGDGLSADIQELYRWLVKEYEPGDLLFFFGYSRGAFTARSLVGMVRNAGLLPASADEREVKEAYDLYKDRKHGPDSEVAQDFRKEHGCIPVEELEIAFLGVFDTVGALGVPVVGPRSWIARTRWSFHDLVLSSHVKRAAQALAIDEKRGSFLPAPWCAQADEGNDERAARISSQVVEQAWFAGCHGDVGGGGGKIAQHWIMSRAEDAGLAFEPPAVGAGPTAQELHESMRWFWQISTGEVLRPVADPRFRDQTIHVTAAGLYSDSWPEPDNLKVARAENPLTRPTVLHRGFATWYYLRQYGDVCREAKARTGFWGRMRDLVPW